MQTLFDPKTMLVLGGFFVICVLLAAFWRGAAWLSPGLSNERERERFGWRGYCSSAVPVGVCLYAFFLAPSFSPPPVAAEKPAQAPTAASAPCHVVEQGLTTKGPVNVCVQ